MAALGPRAPLLLLHGAYGSWLHWINNIEDISKTRTVWAPDLPGFGRSTVPPTGKSVADIACALAEGIMRLGINEPIAVAGFSFGGLVAAHLAGLLPDRITRIILVDSGGLGTPLAKISMLPVQRHINDVHAHRHNLLNMMIHDPARVDDLALHVQAVHVPLARIDVRNMVMPDRLLLALERTCTPVDSIWGEFDQPHPDPARQHAALKSVRPGARMRMVPGAGHWSNYENAEIFHRYLNELLY